VKPIWRRPVRDSNDLLRPSNAPPQMNRCPCVDLDYSCCGCLRPPWGGTLATVLEDLEQRLLHASPDTSRVMLDSRIAGDLSISSM